MWLMLEVRDMFFFFASFVEGKSLSQGHYQNNGRWGDSRSADSQVESFYNPA
jgi:hypothetical protein